MKKIVAAMEALGRKQQEKVEMRAKVDQTELVILAIVNLLIPTVKKWSCVVF